MKKIFVIILTVNLFPLLCFAETIQISASTSLHFSIPSGWQWAKEPPESILAEIAEHIGHEAAEKGQTPSNNQLLEAARKRLSANEVLLYNPQSTAYTTLDLSPLHQGERPPGKEAIKLSAKYAGQSLEQEEGVNQLQGQTEKFSIDGAWYAHRYNANYMHHDEKMYFSGVIGFSSPYWFFFYYTDYLKDPADRQKAEEIFKSIRIETEK